jgi:hypothetical protein
MKTLTLLTLSLLSYYALADSPTHSKPAVFYFTSHYQQQASFAWQKRPRSLDPWWLDQFIATYPHSEEAPLAFTLRFAMTRGTAAIAAYESFIKTYPHTLATQQAIYELFSLYCNPQRQDLTLHLKGCLAFMLRYPNTPHALVAQAEAQKTAFIKVTQADKLAGYKEYLALFPNAPQTVTVEQLALNKAVADEQHWLKKQLGQLPEYNQQQLDTLKAQTLEQNKAEPDNIISTNHLGEIIQRKRNNRANSLATQFGTLAHQQDVLESHQWQQQHGPQPIDTSTELGQTLKQHYSKILRLSHVLRVVYPDTEAAREIRAEERHRNLLRKLEAIHQTLAKNHTELVNVIQQEFATTRQLLKNEFERLRKEGLQPIHQALTQLVKGMEVLHQDLRQVNQHLVKLHQSMDDVKGLIQENNHALEQLHQDLGNVHQAVKAMHQDMNQGYEKQAHMLKQVNHSLQTGFQQVHHDLELQRQQDAQHHRESVEIQTRLLDTTKGIVSGINQLGTQITNSTQNQTEALLKQMVEGTAIFKTSQAGILKAIKEQTEQGIVNTNELLSAQNQTRQALNEQFQTNLNKVRETVSESSPTICIIVCF